MPKSKSRKKRPPKRVLALPDLEHTKPAVLNSLTSPSGQQVIEAVRPAFDRYVHGDEVRFTGACWMVSARADGDAR